ncbi:class I SAM-dependent methyltransferase [Telmatospirillum siberiense]|uniref:Class I SAM-dependent methyltransferase n=1 Tax=Telmatospirillum siberiense TaxID=382514 RepID=A0A2N3Q006_9PROT|nr:class I SAM-dependent methyltransferase [Telmatospirillum siberiense]PKU25979.1 class I SAM-dependent methyltransferase [Telmatospirillum siberiense]
MTETVQTIGSHDGERIAQNCVCCGSRNLARSPAILMPFVAYRAFGWQAVEITPEWGLRTIPTGLAYPLCNSVQCADCGLLFLDIRFNNFEMNAMYHGYRSSAYAEMRGRFEPGYLATNVTINNGVTYVPQIEDFLSPHLHFPVRILDWGGDTGQNAPFAAQRSLLHVYDISDRPVVSGGELVGQATVQSTEYDLIICANVLEHIPYPGDVVRDIGRSMHRDTVLYVEVPREPIFSDDETSKELHKKKRHWHEHINFFSDQSLTELMERSGLKIIDRKLLNVSDGYHNYYRVLACKLK